MTTIKKQPGFTLVEVLVALAIFSVSALVLLQQSGRSSHQAMLLETRTLASWIAENELARLRLATTFPTSGESKSDVRFGGREWLLLSTLENTTNPDLLRARVQVFLADKPDDRRFELTGFLGRN